MAIKAISKLTEEWYTPEDQRGLDESERPARFKIKPLNGIQSAELINELRQDGDKMFFTKTGLKLALNYGLVGWENIDIDGQDLNYSVANMSRIPATYLHEVAGEILEKSTLSGEDQKK